MRWIDMHIKLMGRTISFYPNATSYLIGSAIIISMTAGWLNREQALLLMLIGFVIVLMLALRRESIVTKREVESVHSLVNSRYDEMVKLLEISDLRVIQLTKALEKAGVVVPDKPPKGTP